MLCCSQFPPEKRKPLLADLPRIEVIHDLPEHELTCACGCRKYVIGEPCGRWGSWIGYHGAFTISIVALELHQKKLR
jgi:hypothetical protein